MADVYFLLLTLTLFTLMTLLVGLIDRRIGK